MTLARRSFLTPEQETRRKEINQKRCDYLNKFDINFMFLTPDEQWDVIEGRAKLSSYQNVLILDYTLGKSAG